MTADAIDDTSDFIGSNDRIDMTRKAVERMLTIGELKPGQRLNELAIAARLGVGRSVVRETVRALEYDGLLITKMNHGAYVSVVDLDDALEIYDTNAILFGYAAHEISGRVTSGQLLVLASLVDDMDHAIVKSDQSSYWKLNMQFHERIFEFAANRHAARIYGVAAKRLALLRAITFSSVENMRASNEEHRAIVDAIMTKKSDLARKLAEDHGLNGRKRFLLANAPSKETRSG